MDEHFCPMCGVPHGGAAEAEAIAEVDTAAEITDASVRIAEIEAARDVQLARISAGMMDAERDQDLAHAEGIADGMRQVVETIAPPSPGPEPGPEPVIINAPVDVDQDDDDAPPEHGSEPPAAPQKRGLGMWGS